VSDLRPERGWSERRDLNSGPPVPQTGALTGLRYAPNGADYRDAGKAMQQRAYRGGGTDAREPAKPLPRAVSFMLATAKPHTMPSTRK
jgi:hypothetical protein